MQHTDNGHCELCGAMGPCETIDDNGRSLVACLECLDKPPVLIRALDSLIPNSAEGPSEDIRIRDDFFNSISLDIAALKQSIDENPAIDTGFHGNTANKFCNGFADTVNPTVLVGTNLETPVRVLELHSTAGEIVFEKISGESCLA